ncbi:Ff.00g079980.m01.CDS01 [Fusarium sp. VM40]|nr:Ff.00g079980.m01.CDS01 [Fusarium sp. VM40]
MTSIEARKLAVLATLMASDIPPPPDPLPYGWPINSTHVTRLITDPEYASRKVNKKMELAILEILWGDYMQSQQAAASRSMFDEAQGMGEKVAEQRDQQSDDEKLLLQIDWSPENRRMPTQPLTEEQKKLSKIPMTGWSAMERDVAMILFHNDLLEYDSDVTEEEAQHGKRNRPIDLSKNESKFTPPTRQ